MNLSFNLWTKKRLPTINFFFSFVYLRIQQNNNSKAKLQNTLSKSRSLHSRLSLLLQQRLFQLFLLFLLQLLLKDLIIDLTRDKEHG